MRVVRRGCPGGGWHAALAASLRCCCFHSCPRCPTPSCGWSKGLEAGTGERQGRAGTLPTRAPTSLGDPHHGSRPMPVPTLVILPRGPMPVPAASREGSTGGKAPLRTSTVFFQIWRYTKLQVPMQATKPALSLIRSPCIEIPRPFNLRKSTKSHQFLTSSLWLE